MRTGRWTWSPRRILVAAAVAAVTVAALFLTRPRSTGPARPDLPDFVLERPEPVNIAYAYAIAHPEVLTRIPCYCGCVKFGHLHNYGCFIRALMPDGRIIFDSHASG
jgi:hypothetical protein